MNDVTTQDLTSAVREAAMLASLSIGVWEANKTDAGLLEEVKQRHNATGNVGKVIKNILAGADGKLKEVHSAYYAIRTKHYEMTLPWVSDPHAARQRGPRLLPHLLFNAYSLEMARLLNVAKGKLEEFLVEFPMHVQNARTNLGGMADINYPTVEDIKPLFRVHFDFEPIPEGASFKGLDDFMLERLGKKLQSKQERQVTEAVGAMWTEAKERIQHLVTRLGYNDEGEVVHFKEATVENVRELLTLLPGWNITKNPLVNEVVADINTMLDGVDAKKLRKDLTARASTADKAKAIADKLAAWNL